MDQNSWPFVLSLSKDEQPGARWFDKPVLSLPKRLTTNGIFFIHT
jgi:hypothetical protein